ncbi:MAG: kinase/pyrophosphorylase [Coriobacteriales bacterium]|jgi:regulator of PEP synthase PpsR (kinase-PPPase family)|nr:kinase/pyrophosphorylase [Coriobacteriales bacterium]
MNSSVIHIISDSVGDSAAVIAEAAASQFTNGDCKTERLPNVTSVNQVAEFIDKHLNEANGEEIVVLYTIATRELREELQAYFASKNVAAVDLLGPSIAAIAEATGLRPAEEPGIIRKTDEEYFTRVEAMEFAVDHDDGRQPEGLTEADIVLIGASRTSKTPISIYLGTQGYRVANVPLAPETDPPKQLFDVERSRIFGLTSDPTLLSEIRYRRLGNAVHVAGQYADPTYVQEDLDEARALMRRLGCIVIHTDNRAVEETAQEILRYYEAAHETVRHGADAA